MRPGNPRPLTWLLDAVAAAAGAVVGYPLAIILWTGEVFSTLEGLFRMSGSEWAIILTILNGPSALLGLFAGRLFRRRKESGPAGAVVAAAAALAVSTGTGLAFGWWLSPVL